MGWTRTRTQLHARCDVGWWAAAAVVGGGDERTAWLKKLSSPHRELAEWLGRQLDQLEPLREEAERRLLAEAKKHPIIRKLSKAPGMGPIRTAQVVATVATPERFRTRRHCWSYSVGIVTRSSADWVQDRTGKWVRGQHTQTRGLSRKRHPRLKAVFKGAATTVIAQLADAPLQADYERMLKSGIKPTLAKLTLARKVAATVLSMWKHQEVYDPKRHRSTPEQKQLLGSRRREAVRLRTLPLENGSGESIHSSAGVPDATGMSMLKAMPPRSADLSDGPRRPFQEHGAPLVRESRQYCFTLNGAYVRTTHHSTNARA